jgi:hypothetical protein
MVAKALRRWLAECIIGAEPHRIEPGVLDRSGIR